MMRGHWTRQYVLPAGGSVFDVLWRGMVCVSGRGVWAGALIEGNIYLISRGLPDCPGCGGVAGGAASGSSWCGWRSPEDKDGYSQGNSL